jgi:hypothetical protein
MKLTFCLLLAVAAFGQEALNQPQYWTGEYRNCRVWMLLPDTGRQGFLLGFLEGYVYHAGGIKSLPAKKNILFDHAPTNAGEMAGGVTSICSAPENANIPVWAAFEIHLIKVEGASQEQIDTLLSEARRGAVQALQQQGAKGFQ